MATRDLLRLKRPGAMKKDGRRIGTLPASSLQHPAPGEPIGGPKRSPPLECRLRQFLAAQESERHDLGRTLHDDIGQLLAALFMQLHVASDSLPPNSRPALEECLSITRQVIDRVREMSVELYPSTLDSLGLSEAMRCYLDDQSHRFGVPIRFLTSASWTRLPKEIEAVCFRLAQQAVGHALRHASATQIQVELRHDAEAIHLTVRDDGSGFETGSFSPCNASLPWGELAALCQRVELLTGRCSIEGMPGRGTLIQICLPVDTSSACGAQAALQVDP